MEPGRGQPHAKTSALSADFLRPRFTPEKEYILERMPSLPGRICKWTMFQTVFRSVRRPGRVQLRQFVSSTNPHIVVSEEVREAVQHGRPVVALESTIYTHGTYLLAQTRWTSSRS